jgi:hypothetical protein
MKTTIETGNVNYLEKFFSSEIMVINTLAKNEKKKQKTVLKTVK